VDRRELQAFLRSSNSFFSRASKSAVVVPALSESAITRRHLHLSGGICKNIAFQLCFRKINQVSGIALLAIYFPVSSGAK